MDVTTGETLLRQPVGSSQGTAQQHPMHGQHLTTKNYVAPNVSSVKAEKPWSNPKCCSVTHVLRKTPSCLSQLQLKNFRGHSPGLSGRGGICSQLCLTPESVLLKPVCLMSRSVKTGTFWLWSSAYPPIRWEVRSSAERPLPPRSLYLVHLATVQAAPR